jgi:hypothetical protein
MAHFKPSSRHGRFRRDERRPQGSHFVGLLDWRQVPTIRNDMEFRFSDQVLNLIGQLNGRNPIFLTNHHDGWNVDR